MFVRVTVLGRENIEDGDGLAAEIFDRRCECAPSREQLTLAFGETALANGADFAPQHGTIGDRAVLKSGEIRTIDIGIDLVVFHACEKNFAGSAGVKRRRNAKIGHAAHGMQTLHGIDVYAGITRSDREDYRLIHGVANFAHRRRCNIVDIGLTAPYVRQSQQLEAETVFAGLRIAFAVTALDEAAQDSKHRRLGQPYCGYDLPEAPRRLPRLHDGFAWLNMVMTLNGRLSPPMA